MGNCYMTEIIWQISKKIFSNKYAEKTGYTYGKTFPKNREKNQL